LGVQQTTGVIERWADQSGQGRDASQATPAARPTYLSNWKSGKPALKFDATDDSLKNTTSSIFGSGDDITLFVVGARDVDPDAVQLNDKWFGLLAPVKNHSFQTVRVANTLYYFTDGSSSDVPTLEKFEIATNPAYIMWASDGEGGSTTLLVRIKGSARTAIKDMPDFPDGVTGYEISGRNNDFCAKKIGEVIAYNRLLSVAEIAQVEKHITDFWGAF
jgi:hypothetical protein